MSKSTSIHDEGGKAFSPEALSPAEHAHEVGYRDQQSQQYMANEPMYDRIAFSRVPLTVKNTRALVITLGVFAAFSGMLSGLDQSVISGALPGIRQQFIKLGERHFPNLIVDAFRSNGRSLDDDTAELLSRPPQFDHHLVLVVLFRRRHLRWSTECGHAICRPLHPRSWRGY